MKNKIILILLSLLICSLTFGQKRVKTATNYDTLTVDDSTVIELINEYSSGGNPILSDVTVQDTTNWGTAPLYHTDTVDIASSTPLTVSNPFTYPIIPRIVQVYENQVSGGGKIDVTIGIDTSDGDIILYFSSSRSDAEVQIIGW